jgi:hypothetical protein
VVVVANHSHPPYHFVEHRRHDAPKNHSRITLVSGRYSMIGIDLVLAIVEEGHVQAVWVETPADKAVV